MSLQTETIDDHDFDPAIEAIKETTELVVAQATAIAITDQDSFEDAGVFLTETLKPALKEIAATFDPIVSAAHTTHKEAVAQRNRHAKPLREAERIVKSAMGGYITEQRRIAAAAETERLRLAREEAETAALAEAERLEAAGHDEAAIELISAPVVPVVSAPPPEAPKAAGVSSRMVTKYRIINASAIAPAYLKPDEKKIGKVVDAFGAEAQDMVGGIEVYEEPVIAASAR